MKNLSIYEFVSDYESFIKTARNNPHQISMPSPRIKSEISFDSPKAMMFSPHPDDGPLVSGILLRIQYELGYEIINVATTLGSKKERQMPRYYEDLDACNFLGFKHILPDGGFENINLTARSESPLQWNKAVDTVANILAEYQPEIVILPHDDDHHTTHIGTNYLVFDALKMMDDYFQTCLIETEYWRPMKNPNLMIELSAKDVTDMICAVSLYRGEVERNPYHITLLAKLSDNVRLGAELLNGQGGNAPDFVFASLYRMSIWEMGKAEYINNSKLISKDDSLEEIFYVSEIAEAMSV